MSRCLAVPAVPRWVPVPRARHGQGLPQLPSVPLAQAARRSGRLWAAVGLSRSNQASVNFGVASRPLCHATGRHESLCLGSAAAFLQTEALSCSIFLTRSAPGCGAFTKEQPVASRCEGPARCRAGLHPGLCRHASTSEEGLSSRCLANLCKAKQRMFKK